MLQEHYGREEWLRLLGLGANTFNQRQHKGEIALAFGLSKPVHMNDYSALDAFAVLLTHILSARARVELRIAADMARRLWLAWLKGLALAERDMSAAPYDYVFAVGATFSEDRSKNRFSAGAGKRQDAIDEVEKAGKHDVLYLMPLELVLRQLRANAREFKVQLPKMLTAASPADAEAFERWLGQIAEYRRLADVKTKAKAKKAKAMA